MPTGNPAEVCRVSRRAARVGLFLTTRRAGKLHVVTASKCRVHRSDSYFYLIPFKNWAVIMRRDFLWLHGDRRGGIFGQPLFDAVLCHCYELFYSKVELEWNFTSSGSDK